MLKNIYAFLLICFLGIQCENETFQWQAGDLLFQKWDSSDFAKAINKVTHGYDNQDFAHVGMVVEVDGKLKVFDATMAKGVSLSSIEDFLNLSLDKETDKPLVSVGRLKKELHSEIPKINNWLVDHLDKPYDTLFVYGNDKYYCSELIHDAFNFNSGKEIFKLQPMTFKDPDTRDFFPIWVDYFSEHKAPIPEGAPGINPGLMSRSSELEIVKEFYK